MYLTKALMFKVTDVSCLNAIEDLTSAGKKSSGASFVLFDFGISLVGSTNAGNIDEVWPYV